MIIARLLVSGLPATGKTTLIEKYQDHDNIITLDTDSIGKWSEGENPEYLVDLDLLRTKMSEFEAIQKNNETQHYIFILAGFSGNTLAVSKILKGWGYVDMWLHVTEKTQTNRLTKRADTAHDGNWWKLFKGKPDEIKTIVQDLQDIDPKTVMSNLDDDNILSYDGMVKLIDGFIDEMEAKPSRHAWIPETNDEEGRNFLSVV